MRGNLVKITIGDYIIDLPGIIKDIGFDFDDEGGWDIARNTTASGARKYSTAVAYSNQYRLTGQSGKLSQYRLS